MTDRLITHLRHVDLAVPDYDKQLDFYAGVWGLTKVAEDSGISFLAAEGSPEQYVVRLRKAGEKRLDLVSYGAASSEDVHVLLAKRQTWYLAGNQAEVDAIDAQLAALGYDR